MQNPWPKPTPRTPTPEEIKLHALRLYEAVSKSETEAEKIWNKRKDYHDQISRIPSFWDRIKCFFGWHEGVIGEGAYLCLYCEFEEAHNAHEIVNNS